ncbi:MAG: hypothetical protein KF769_14940 [Parvibaculum sp.]|nr:hypothetical protein [Parvibaculum sp.]
MSRLTAITETIFGVSGSLFALAALLVPTPIPSLNSLYVTACVLENESQEWNDTVNSIVELASFHRQIIYVDKLALDFYGYAPSTPSASLTRCPRGEGHASYKTGNFAAIVPLDDDSSRIISRKLANDRIGQAAISEVSIEIKIGGLSDDDRFSNVMFSNAIVGVSGAVLPIVRQVGSTLEITLSGVDIAATELVEEYECTLQLVDKGFWRGYFGCVSP